LLGLDSGVSDAVFRSIMPIPVNTSPATSGKIVTSSVNLFDLEDIEAPMLLGQTMVKD
jgi:hypothetical protein